MGCHNCYDVIDELKLEFDMLQSENMELQKQLDNIYKQKCYHDVLRLIDLERSI